MSKASAHIYLRISLDATGERAGVERQEEECRALCGRHGWDVAGVHVDNSVSATSGARRPGFEELLSSKPERIVVWHLDRLVRLTTDLERVLALGVDVHSVAGGMFDLSNPAGRAVARTVTAWSQYETEQKGERQRSSHRQRRREGRPWWTRRPFGYNLDGTLHETEAPVLRQAYADVLAGASMRGIAREWEAKGVRSTPRKNLPEGKPFGPTAVRALILHPRNIGKLTRSQASGAPEELAQDGAWEPLVDVETFRKVERLLSQPGRRLVASTKRKGLLVGVLYCDACDTPMRLSQQTTHGRVYRHYTCQTRCNSWPREWLDDHMTETALALLASPSFRPAEDGPDDGEGDELRAEVERLATLIDELLEDRREGILTRAQWREQHELATEDLRKAQGELEALEGSRGTDSLDGLGRSELLAWWQDEERGVDGQRELLRHLFGDVTCKPRGRGAQTVDRQLLSFERNGWANSVGLRVIEPGSELEEVDKG